MIEGKIWLSMPHMGGNEQKFIQEAFDSNWIAPIGANLSIFEQNLENYLGSGHVAVLNSGTAAIHLGLILLGVKAVDEVLCQSMTFSASANPILYLGATPVFIDSESETWNLCPVALEKAIVDRIARGKKPKAIIAVDLYGVAYKIAEIRAIADNYSIPILEDRAEALGSRYKGQKCGNFGDIGILSFNGIKVITTSGGGAIVTNSVVLKDRAVFLATQAREDVPHYEHIEIGYNYRMSNICAGIGRGQMEVLESHLILRRKMHDFYVNVFKDIQGVNVFTVPNDNFFSNYWLSTILVDPVKTRGITIEMVLLNLEKANIESRSL
jgi:dTDP-4-amino-4,6-dideoxygalactose transaminase